ncbi:MAG: topoisomerase C-terminal repeat-containing protein [Lachnospiraceae bacterium]|nr:topoisomerase C-terminal repeat-containing protein [Lachnospiraceae bacterium]
MAKALIITEKPSVARDFARVLNVSGNRKGYIENNDYVISWCVGHLVGLVYPEAYDVKYKKWKAEDLPFLPENYKYDVIPEVKEQYEIVHGLLQREDIDTVYWAGDAGKEGQTIEENIRNFGGVRSGMSEKRVWIDSQTDEEMLRGIREAKDMSCYKNLGLSGIMRTIEDYAMGINFSRVMSINYGRLLNNAGNLQTYRPISVGRVMTCVLGMVVIREREIRSFVETPFYKVIGSFADGNIKGEWKATKGSYYEDSYLLYKENGFKERKSAEELIDKLSGKSALVEEIEKSKSKKKAPLLFNLAELQAECAKRFKISPDETLAVAQTLYERKMTTYPRTDARVLSTAVAKEIIKNLNGLKKYESTVTFVDNIINNKLYEGIAKTAYTDDSKITDHYAIIPTGQVDAYKGLNDLEKSIYDLIVRRFLSIFYPPAEYDSVKLTINVDNEKFYASAKVLSVPGYLEIAGKKNVEKDESEEGEENNDDLLKLSSTLKKGDSINVSGYDIGEGKTTPPKRYTSGSMILAMENAGQLIEDEELRAQIKGSGIGTSATRAEIIDKLVRIGYLNLNKKTQVLTPEKFGEMVYEVVDLNVPQLLNPKMTASWEKGLDGITNGTVDFAEYRGKLEDFIRNETVSMINTNVTDKLMDRIKDFVELGSGNVKGKFKIGAICPMCGGELVTTPFGYGCEKYSKEGNGCNFAIGQIAGKSLDVNDVKKLITEGKTGLIKGFTSKAGKKFDAVLKMEKDDAGKVTIGFDFDDKEAYLLKDMMCPVCAAPLKKTGFGYICSNKDIETPTCNFSIGSICGKTITEAQVKKLLKDGKTDLIKGFKSKAGKKFDAMLKLDNGEIKFEFADAVPPAESSIKCPNCDNKLIRTKYYYECTCGFKISHMVAQINLSENIVEELIMTGHTKEKVTGFHSKSGSLFDARLKYDKETGISFDFEDKNTNTEG